MPARAGRHHPLLIYRRQFSAWRLPALLIAALCGALTVLAPGPLANPLARNAMVAATVLASILFGYTLLAPGMAYVQCRPTHLRVCAPLFQMAISYSRIRTTRPVEFQPEARGSRRWLADPFLGRTVLAVDLTGYPIAPRWLRLWLNEFVLPGSFMGLLFVTPDWMALSREIDSFRGEWKGMKADRRVQSLASQITRPR